MAVRIAILSDDRLFADGLVRIVKTDIAFAVAGAIESRDGLQAALAHRPHILIIDSRLANAIDRCAKATGGLPGKASAPSVVFVAAPEDDNWAIEALTAGARGILGQRAAPDDLHKALRAVIDGEIWSSRRVLTTWLARLTSPPQPAPSAAIPWDLHTLLSDREREVLSLIAEGKSNKEIAMHLGIGVRTTETHRERIMRKLDIHSVAGLTKFAIANGISSLEEGEKK